MSEFKQKLERTRKKLLDLSKRNRLINYRRPNKARNLIIIDESLEFIYQRLVLKEKKFRFKSIPDPKMSLEYSQLKERLKSEKENYFNIDGNFNDMLDNIRWSYNKKPLILNFTPIFKKYISDKQKLKESIVELTKEIDRLNLSVAEQAKKLGFKISNQMPQIDLDDKSIDSRYKDSYLQTMHYPTELEKILKKIELDSRSIIEESGSNMLYLILGVLEWREKSSIDDKIKSPLITIPVSLKRGKLNSQTNSYDYTLEYTGDLIDTNRSLSEKFKQDFNMGFPEITENLSFSEYIKEVQKICDIKDGWYVRHEISLNFLQFGKILMYKDLDTNNWLDNSLENNQVLRELFLGKENLSTPRTLIDYDIDNHKTAKNIPLVLDADSSQHSAIVDVMEGKNIVIEGPPGTGKSQTISNMIASLMANGKSVLFVSEKLAALEVVYKRLEDVGLGDFCLELHSHKSQKTKVLKNLKERLEGSYIAPTQLKSLKYRVASKKRELKTHLDILHQKYGNSDKKLFEIFWLVEKYNYASKYLKFELQEAKSLTSTDINSRIEELEKFIKFYKKYNFNDFYWSGFCTYRLSFVDIDNLIELLGKAQQEFIEIDRAFKLFPFNIDDEYDELQNISLFTKTLLSKSHSSDMELLKTLSVEGDKLLNYLNEYSDFIDSLDLVGDNIVDLIESSESLVKIAQTINSSEINLELLKYKRVIDKTKKRADKYQETFDRTSKKLYTVVLNSKSMDYILEIERVIEDKKDSFFNFFSSEYKKAKRRFESLLLKRLPKDKSTWLYLIRDMKDYLINKKIIDELREASSSFIEKVTTINEKIDKTLKLYDDINSSKLDVNIKTMLIKDFEQKEILDRISLHHGKLESIYTKLYSYGDIEKSFWGDNPLKITKCIEKLNYIDKEREKLSLWSDFSKVSKRLKELGLKNIVKSVTDGNLPVDDIIANFNYNLYNSLLALSFREYAILNDFSRVNHEKTVKSFIKADLKLLKLNQEHIAFKATKRKMPPSQGKGSVKSFTNLRLLEHEISKKRRHIPIRQLIKRAGGAIQAIKPCFMMSPLSVAQYLPPNLLHFDVLLIDEASQLRPEEALGVIARATQIVIVGDPKQLPPTSFFNTLKDNGDQEEDTIVDEAESILDSCIDIYSPARRLKWHYRSQHESLIDFSNQHFYDNDLIIFPSPTSLSSEELGVKYSYIEDGIYQSGARHRYNIIEAQTLISHIEQQIEKYPNKSLGIGTFNVTQRDIIQELIDEKEKNNPQVANYIAKWRETSEPFFIKNLESLQGDERDVIFISTTYGKDKITGKVMQRFGPINQDVGWRRLNVLVTRAKQKMHIFTSLQSSDIITSNSSSKGLIAFKSFLHYLERGIILQRAIDTDRGFDSPFEESVYQLLKARGIKTVPQVGVSGYFIDLAVVAKDSDDYILAIECDGASYHSSKSAIDRDRLKEEVLKRLGWSVYRIWSVDWYKNRDNEIEKLVEKIDEIHNDTLLKKS